MAYHDKGFIENMSIEEKQKGELAIFGFLLNVAILIESICAISYSINYALEKDILPILQFILAIGLILLSMGLIALQQYSLMKCARAYIFTPSIWDEWAWGLAALALSVLIFVVDYNGSKDLLNSVNGYSAVKRTYKDDDNYNKTDKDRSVLKAEAKETERLYADKLNECNTCKKLDAQYALKKKSKKKGKANEQAWVNAENNKIAAFNSKIDIELNEKKSEARELIEKERDEKLAKIQSKIDILDGTTSKLALVIDSANISETKKEELQKAKNESTSLLLTPITQLLIFFMRFLIMKLRKKEGKDWAEKGLFLLIQNIFAPVGSFVDNLMFEFNEKSKNKIAVSKLKVIDRVDAHRASIGDSRLDIALVAKSPDELRHLLGGQSTGVTTIPSSTPIPNNDIQDIIDGYQILYDMAIDEGNQQEADEIIEIIEAFQILLTI